MGGGVDGDEKWARQAAPVSSRRAWEEPRDRTRRRRQVGVYRPHILVPPRRLCCCSRWCRNSDCPRANATEHCFFFEGPSIDEPTCHGPRGFIGWMEYVVKLDWARLRMPCIKPRVHNFARDFTEFR